MQVFGHRGAAGYSPENSLPSFRKALSMHVDGVEFDVRITKDEVPVVIHDETLDRTTSVSGSVADFSSMELRRLLAAQAERVPTLFDVIREVRTVTRINVELKEIQACEPTFRLLERCVDDAIIENHQILLTSFEHAAVERFRALSDHYAVGLLTKGTPADAYWELANRLRAASANIDLASVNSDFVHRAHRQGLAVMVYTVNFRDDALGMKQLGVDAIFSDFPDRVRV